MSPGAVVVDVLVALAIGLVLGGHGQAASATAHQASVRKGMLLRFAQKRSAHQGLHAVKFFQTDDGLVLARIKLPLPADEPCIEGVLQEFVEHAVAHRHAAGPALGWRSVAPLFVGNAADRSGGVPAGEHQNRTYGGYREHAWGLE